jgi:hypothetical protein
VTATSRTDPSLRFRWLGFRIVPVSHCALEAIRSVTHLVLALRGGQCSGTLLSNRKERDGTMPGPDSLRLGFLGHRSFTTAVASVASRHGTGLAPNPGYSRIQKTFSAGPCSFNTRELWFPGRLVAAGVQPVSDSRHGRIACKVSLSPLSKRTENRRFQSSLRAQGPTPLPVNGGSHNISLCSLIDKFRRTAAPNQPKGLSRPTPLLVSGSSHKIISSSVPVLETSGRRRNRSAWP